CSPYSDAPSPPNTSSLSLPHALPISHAVLLADAVVAGQPAGLVQHLRGLGRVIAQQAVVQGRVPVQRVFRDIAERRHHLAEQDRSEEHTSELQSREKLVCRLLLENRK